MKMIIDVPQIEQGPVEKMQGSLKAAFCVAWLNVKINLGFIAGTAFYRHI
jgi:hypothetical protein